MLQPPYHDESKQQYTEIYEMSVPGTTIQPTAVATSDDKIREDTNISSQMHILRCNETKNSKQLKKW